jgi:hypothetical protein
MCGHMHFACNVVAVLYSPEQTRLAATACRHLPSVCRCRMSSRLFLHAHAHAHTAIFIDKLSFAHRTTQHFKNSRHL